jgi:hypothetical protein
LWSSVACKTCHPQIFERWKKTRMANVVTIEEYPDAIIPDWSKADPLLNFKNNRSRSAATGNSLFHKCGRRLLPAPAQGVGRHAPGMARLHGKGRNRLVGTVLSGR